MTNVCIVVLISELSLKDCRLLDKCTVKKDFLVPFVEALKGISSLQSLMLAQNRLGKTELAITIISFHKNKQQQNSLTLIMGNVA